MNQFEQVPEVGMQDGVAARNIKVWPPLHPCRHALNVCKHSHQSLPRHLYESWMSLGEDVTVLATLVTLVGDVPLKGEIVQLSIINCQLSIYFSPAPQAEPHAAGFSSAGLSAAPQAEPHAAGFSSAGLSAAPQAAPQAAGFSLCFIIPCALCAKLKSTLFILMLVFVIKQ